MHSGQDCSLVACMQDVTVESSMVGDGCIIQPGCTISNSVVGLRSKIYANTIVEDSLLMGTDYYERPEDCELAAHCLPMGIGSNSCVASWGACYATSPLVNACSNLHLS
jgi:ADP-glucose pyrophosphorylase